MTGEKEGGIWRTVLAEALKALLEITVSLTLRLTSFQPNDFRHHSNIQNAEWVVSRNVLSCKVVTDQLVQAIGIYLRPKFLVDVHGVMCGFCLYRLRHFLS